AVSHPHQQVLDRFEETLVFGVGVAVTGDVAVAEEPVARVPRALGAGSLEFWLREPEERSGHLGLGRTYIDRGQGQGAVRTWSREPSAPRVVGHRPEVRYGSQSGLAP